jgi:hypothetical protein
VKEKQKHSRLIERYNDQVLKNQLKRKELYLKKLERSQRINQKVLLKKEKE